MARNTDTRTARRVQLPGIQVHRHAGVIPPAAWRTPEPWLIVAVALAVSAGGAVLIALPRTVSRGFLTESGPVENATALLYLAAAVAAAALAFRSGMRILAAAAVVLLSFGFRELDFHDRFTTRAISQLRFFTSAQVPTVEKAVGTVILLALAVAAGWLVREAVSVVRGGRSRALLRPGAVSATAGAVLLPISLLCDRLVRLLTYDRGLDPDGTLPYLLWITEEMTEMASPLLFLVALLFWALGRQRSRREPRRDARRNLGPV